MELRLDRSSTPHVRTSDVVNRSELKLAKPITGLSKGKLTVSAKDGQGTPSRRTGIAMPLTGRRCI
jgi:hypothetical protein